MVLLFSCAVTLPPREGWMTNYEIKEDLQEQEKDGITITLEPVNDLDLEKYPEYFQFDFQKWGPSWSNGARVINFWYPPNKDGNSFANTFMGMPTFFVSVKNSTGHILRMSEARIYLIVEGKDPIPAISEFGNAELVSIQLVLYGNKPETANICKSAIDGDSSLLDYITRREVNFIRAIEKAKKNAPEYRNYPSYPLNICRNVATINSHAYKLINQVGREILPDFSLNGILCFPFDMEKEQKAKIVFYDITTKTDQAGNPAKKTQFEFDFEYKPRYMRYNEITKLWEKQEPLAD